MRTIDATGMHYRTLNEQVKNLCQTESSILLENVNGQRYIGDGLQCDTQIIINGVPGNDLGVFMDGPSIVVNGNIQDAAANTMNNGKIMVHGCAGDTLGYGMRGGEVFIRDDVGYRSGIHMKEYAAQIPVLVIGGAAGDFLGEYMAGGLILVLNRKSVKKAVGDYCASGMHGGKIFIRSDQCIHVPDSIKVGSPGTADMEILKTYIKAFEEYFQDSIGIRPEEFQVLSPANSRPYHNLYVGI